MATNREDATTNGAEAKPAAPAPAAKTTLSPAAAWPFPTSSRP